MAVEPDKERIPLSALAVMEWIAGLALGNFILLLALTVPPDLGTPPAAAPVASARAPWIFGAVQLLLQSFAPRVGGVLIPLLGIAALAAAPFLARRGNRGGRAFFWGAYVGVVVLTVYSMIRG